MDVPRLVDALAVVKAVTAVMDRLPPAHRWLVVVLAAAVAGLAGHQLGLW